MVLLFVSLAERLCLSAPSEIEREEPDRIICRRWATVLSSSLPMSDLLAHFLGLLLYPSTLVFTSLTILPLLRNSHLKMLVRSFLLHHYLSAERNSFAKPYCQKPLAGVDSRRLGLRRLDQFLPLSWLQWLRLPPRPALRCFTLCRIDSRGLFLLKSKKMGKVIVVVFILSFCFIWNQIWGNCILGFMLKWRSGIGCLIAWSHD